MKNKSENWRIEVIRELSEKLNAKCIKEEMNGMVLKDDASGQLLKLRFAGQKTIDISPVDCCFCDVDKSYALQQLNPIQNVVFWGNEVGKGARDSSVCRSNKTNAAKVVSVANCDSQEIEQGVLNLADKSEFQMCINNIERTKKSLQLLNKICVKSSDLYQCSKSFLDSLGFDTSFAAMQEFFLCFDVDDTLLGHSPIYPYLRETFSNERQDICEELILLWAKGYNIVFVSDNSYENIVERIITPLLFQKNKKNKYVNLKPIQLFCNGSLTHVIISEDGCVELNEEYSTKYILSDVLVADVIEFVEYLNSKTEFKKAIRERLWPQNQINNQNDLLFNLEIRRVPTRENFVNQLSIKAVIKKEA